MTTKQTYCSWPWALLFNYPRKDPPMTLSFLMGLSNEAIAEKGSEDHYLESGYV